MKEKATSNLFRPERCDCGVEIKAIKKPVSKSAHYSLKKPEARHFPRLFTVYTRPARFPGNKAIILCPDWLTQRSGLGSDVGGAHTPTPESYTLKSLSTKRKRLSEPLQGPRGWRLARIPVRFLFEGVRNCPRAASSHENPPIYFIYLTSLNSIHLMYVTIDRKIPSRKGVYNGN